MDFFTQLKGIVMDKRKREDYLIPVPGQKGVYRYIPQNPNPSFAEILEAISTPVVIERGEEK